MIRHIVLLSIKPESTPEQLETLRGEIAAMLDMDFPHVHGFRWGANLAAPERRHGFDWGFQMDFPDMDSLHAYAVAPAHQPVVQRLRTLCEKVLAFDFEV